jgi:predicted DsbA family dithiol-disulfide isomerase
MVRHDGAEAKRERMEQISRKIQAALYVENPISLSKIVAQVEYDFGLTKTRIKEYLKTLQDLERFKIDEANNQIRKVAEVEKHD